jgi:hypothetical protein
MSVTAAAPSRGKSRDVLARALRRNGIPRDPDLNEPLPKRLLKNRLFWLTVVMIVVYLTLLLLLYVQVVPDRAVAGGTRPPGTEAIPSRSSTRPYSDPPSLLFLWADRYRRRFWPGSDCPAGAHVSRLSFPRRSTAGCWSPEHRATATAMLRSGHLSPCSPKKRLGHSAVLASDPDALPVG